MARRLVFAAFSVSVLGAAVAAFAPLGRSMRDPHPAPAPG